jgi:NAD-dependent dihydropyrimidine dehydrogenase PreA subunit
LSGFDLDQSLSGGVGHIRSVTTATTVRRKIIRIDEAKCDGCGHCLPNCPEGAIQLIEGKARLVSDLMCDGLGACLGHCPRGAITVEEREAAAYDERQVMPNVVQQGRGVIQAHVKHLRDHNQAEYLRQALDYLREHKIEWEAPPRPIPSLPPAHRGGCPGSQAMSFEPRKAAPQDTAGRRASQLRHWPVQLHLINPLAPHFRGSDLLLAADCVPFALADFHRDFLAGKTLAIACPKLDAGQEVYVEKLAALVDQAQINTLTVMIMQVPCCSGLLRLAQTAGARAQRQVPIKSIVVSLQGDILQESWVQTS